MSKLQALPETSMYRQSVEAVTKHRMGLVEKIVPPGYEEWAAKAKELVNKNSAQFRVASGRIDGSEVRTVKLGDKIFVVGRKHEDVDERIEEWDGEADEGAELEGIRTAKEREDQVVWAERKPLEDHEKVEWQDEPQMTADQYVYNPIGKFNCPRLTNWTEFQSWSTRLAPASSRKLFRLPRVS